MRWGRPRAQGYATQHFHRSQFVALRICTINDEPLTSDSSSYKLILKRFTIKVILYCDTTQTLQDAIRWRLRSMPVLMVPSTTWPTFSFKRTLSLSQVLNAEVREREHSIWRCCSEGSWARFLCRTWHWQCTKSGNFRWRRDCGDLQARDTMRQSRSQLVDLQLLRNCYLIYWFGNRK